MTEWAGKVTGEVKVTWEELLHDLVVYLRQHTRGLSKKAIATLLLLAFSRLTSQPEAER